MALADYDPVFEDAGKEWNVDPRLLKAVMMQESKGYPFAVSPAGAQGLMQIMPGTQRQLGVTNPWDPVQSIWGAAKYMSQGLDAEGSPQGALMYYHGGPGWRGTANAPESRGYVPGVASHYVQLAKADTGTATDATYAYNDSPSTDEILKKLGPAPQQPAAAPQKPVQAGQAPSSDDILKKLGPAPVPPGGAGAAGKIDPLTGKPFAFAGPASGPLSTSMGGGVGPSGETLSTTPIREDMIPGPSTQAIISLGGDQEQKRRIAAAQLFPGLKPLEAQSRLFYGPNGRLAAIGDDGQAYYVDPLRSDATVLGVPVPSHPFAYAASGAGPAIPAAAGTATSALAGSSVVGAPLAGAAGAAAGDVFRQQLAAKFDPGSPTYDPKATLGAVGQGALIGATGAAGKVLSEGGPAISGVPGQPPPSGGGGGPTATPANPLIVGRGLPTGPPPPPAPNIPANQAVTSSAVGPASRNPAITQDIPTSSTAAEALAKPYYKMAETSGAGSTPQGTDAIIGLAEDKLPTGLVGEARGGAVPDFVKWMQQFKGKPLTYEDLDNINKELGQRISDDYKFPKGLSDQGRDLFDIQTAIRQRLLNPEQGDLSGDPSGFAAKRAGDKAWAQAKKMEDVENMWAKANETQNPDTSFANQVRNYKYSAKSRGWSDEEIAALSAAAKGGVGSIMHVLGSRMLEHTLTAAGATIGGVTGTAFGPVGTAIGAALGAGGAGVGAHIAGALARRSAIGTTERGVQNALSVLGRGTPPSVLTPPPP